jgi:hypothetical protein
MVKYDLCTCPCPQNIAVCPDGRFLVGRSENTSVLNFMSAKSKEYIDSVHLSDALTDWTFSPDGRYLVATGGK